MEQNDFIHLLLCAKNILDAVWEITFLA